MERLAVVSRGGRGSEEGTARRAEHRLLGATAAEAVNARASCSDDGQPRVERAEGRARESRRRVEDINNLPKQEAFLAGGPGRDLPARLSLVFPVASGAAFPATVWQRGCIQCLLVRNDNERGNVLGAKERRG